MVCVSRVASRAGSFMNGNHDDHVREAYFAFLHRYGVDPATVWSTCNNGEIKEILFRFSQGVAARAKADACASVPPTPTESDALRGDRPEPAAEPAAAKAPAAEAPAAAACGHFSAHFSSLLLSGDVVATALQLILLGALAVASLTLPSAAVDTPGSMRLRELVGLLVAGEVVRRVYNAYLEAVYFCCPDVRCPARGPPRRAAPPPRAAPRRRRASPPSQVRTQPPHEHALAGKADLCARDAEQLEALVWHDRMTLLSQLALELLVYYALPGFHPDPSAPTFGVAERAGRLLCHHYVLSFGMYWMHRTLHVVPILWRRIHSLHHWARHPLSRVTYQDHWLDNLGNAIIGHVCAQACPPSSCASPAAPLPCSCASPAAT